MSHRDSRLVYSTDGGRVPSRRPAVQTATSRLDPLDGFVRLRKEKGGRGGKTVTTMTGLPGSEAELDALLKALKQYCGAGGARNGRTIELQGDHRERLKARLESLGYKVKLAGG